MRSDRARGIALAATLALGGCPSTPYRCARDAQCNASAVCTPTGECAVRVDTATCASGLRYAASAANPGACVAVFDAGAADGAVEDVTVDVAAVDVGIDVAAVDVGIDDAAVDVGADRVVPDASSDADDAPVDAPDLDARVDAPIAMDVVDVPIAMDVVDVPVALDVVDVPDAADVVDVPDVVDAPVARDVAVDGASCDPPALVSPLSGTRLAGSVVDLRPATGSIVEVSPVSDFSRDVVTVSSEVRGLFRVTRAVHGVYFWRARARCGTLALSAPSPVWSFWLRGDQGIGGAAPSGPIGWIPDVNGDGLGDLVVGHPSLAVSGAHTESVEVIFGARGVAPDRDRAASLTRGTAPSGFGAQVAVVPDMNGDGLAEVAVGFCTYPPQTSCANQVWVYPGTRTGAFGAPWVLSAGAMGTRFSASLAGVGDLNGDGFGDLVVGAPGRADATGFAFVYRGGAAGPTFAATLSRTADVVSPTHTTQFGWRAAGPGDVTGDGVADVVLTSFERAWVYPGTGASTLLGAPIDVTSLAASAESTYGFNASPAGDMDNDGLADVALARPGQPNVALSTAGDVSIVLGRRGATSIAPVYTFNGTLPGQRFGLGLAGAADAHADGYDDVLVGAPGDTGSAGTVFLLPGGTTARVEGPATVVSGTATRFGRAVASVGDIDGDNDDDFAVSAGDPNVTFRSGSFVAISHGPPLTDLPPTDGVF